MSNKCNPKKDCNVCKECCQEYIENGDECDKCYEENCKNKCDTSVNEVDVELDDDGNPIELGPDVLIDSNCNVCPDCCQDYIKNGPSCNNCVKDKCDPNDKQFNKSEGSPLIVDNEIPSYLLYYIFITYTIFTFIVFLYYHKLFLSLSNYTRVSYFIILIWLILLLIVSISSLKPLCDSLNPDWNPIQGSFREKYCKYKFNTQYYLVLLTAIISLILLFLVIFDIISIYHRSTFLFIVIVINLVLTMGINLSVANQFTFQFM